METEQPSAQQPSLPAELLRDTVSLCEPASLPSLCLAITILREIASPVLYKSLSFCSPTQAVTFVHAVSPSLPLGSSLSPFLLRMYTRTVPQQATAS
jgi:hypothetical protein